MARMLLFQGKRSQFESGVSHKGLTMYQPEEIERKRILKAEKKHAHKGKNVGAIGGKFTYEFTPTSLGIVVIVRCNICKEKTDVTDYESW